MLYEIIHISAGGESPQAFSQPGNECMKSFILKRLFHSIFVLIGISIVVFIILHLTGDPAALLMPMDATPEQVAQFRKEMGFTDPLIVQYGRFFKGTLRGDFGLSFRHSQPALDLVLERMPAFIQPTTARMSVWWYSICRSRSKGVKD